MNRLAFAAALFALSCTAGTAQSSWGRGKPVPEGCPATQEVNIPPGSDEPTRFQVDFCKPAFSTSVYDYVSRADSDITDSDGHPMHRVEFTQKGDHWLLVAGFRFYKDGSKVSYSRTMEAGNIYVVPGIDILDSHVVASRDCWDSGDIQGLARVKSSGLHAYFKMRLGGDDEYGYVITDCRNGACDADEIGYKLLKQIRFPAYALCPH